MKLKYDGLVIGAVVADRYLSVDEMIEICGVDPNEMLDESTPKYDYELFDTEI